MLGELGELAFVHLLLLQSAECPLLDGLLDANTDGNMHAWRAGDGVPFLDRFAVCSFAPCTFLALRRVSLSLLRWMLCDHQSIITDEFTVISGQGEDADRSNGVLECRPGFLAARRPKNAIHGVLWSRWKAARWVREMVTYWVAVT